MKAFVSTFVYLLLLALPAAHAADTQERWYEYRIADKPVGYVMERTEDAGGGLRKTTSELKMVIARLGAKVEMTTRGVYLEDARGHLKSVHGETSSSLEKTLIEATVGKDGLTVITRAGGRSYTKVIPLTGVLLGPVGSQNATIAQLKKPGDTVSLYSVAAEFGTTVTIKRRLVAREPLTVLGKSLQALRLEETSDILPMPSQSWIDRDGQTLKQIVPSPLGKIELVLTTAEVQKRVSEGAQLPDKLFENSLIRSNVRLPRPRSIEKMVVRIDLKDAASGLPDLTGAYQRVIEKAPGHVVLEITRPRPEDTTAAKPSGITAEFLEPNAILQSDHPDVLKLAAQLKRPNLKPYDQARVLQDWLNRNMVFDPGIALLPASEAARNLRGTCVAYATLLTSLARALDIPARMVMGYVYAGNMWGGHAWAEVRVGNHWIPLDAAVYSPGPADPARIAVISNFKGTTDLGALGQLFGNERIRILSYTLGGKTVELAANAPPYKVEKDLYSNPYLKLSISKPSDFTFTRLDAIYPDMTVVSMRDKQARTVTLLQLIPEAGENDDKSLPHALERWGYKGPTSKLTVAGRQAAIFEGEKKAALVFMDATDLWLLQATGADAGKLLRGVAASLTLN